MKLLKLLTRDVKSAKHSVGFIYLLPAIEIIRIICKGILSFFVYPGNSLDYMLSAMAHILFYLTASGDISMPNVLYHDLQSTVSEKHTLLQLSLKVFTSEDLLYLFQLGSNQLA